MKRSIAAALLSFATLACASAKSPAYEPLVQLSIIDRDTGRTLDKLPFHGERWVEGVPGHRYSIRLTNTSNRRVLAVLSVDGVNAVTGETAAPDQAGYVLGPYQSTEVNGWRKSLSEVAAFEFASLQNSYAARTDRPDNVGVIGVAVFTEKVVPQPRQEISPPHRSSSGEKLAKTPPRAASGAEAMRDSMPPPAPAAPSLGTAHGERETSHATRTTFERASRTPAQVTELRYDRRENLIALGVLPPPHQPYRNRRPEAFPMGFVPDP